MADRRAYDAAVTGWGRQAGAGRTMKHFRANLRQALGLVWEASPRWTLASVGLVFLQGLLPLASLYLLKLLVDAIVAGLASPGPAGALREVILWLGLTAGAVLLADLCRSLSAWTATAQGETVQDHVNDILHAKSIEVDLEYYENAQYYNALHRAQQQAAFRPQRILGDLLQIGQNSLSLAAMAGLLLSLHWGMALLLVATAVPGLLVRLRYARELYYRQREWTRPERQAEYLHQLLTDGAFAKEIRLFDLGGLFRSRFRAVRDQLRAERLDIARKRSLAELATQAGATLALYGAVGVVAYHTLLGAVTVGGLVMYYQALQRGQSYLWTLLTSLAHLYENTLFLSDFREFLALPRTVAEPARPRAPRPPGSGEGLRFEAVSFTYPRGSHPVLRDISLAVRPGETVALVGENGAGKTTLIKLLCRLYDPTVGRITLDGVDLREMTTVALRRQISVLFQDFARYNVTARENIALGDVARAAPLETLQRAARLADADRAIAALPRGYDTILGKQFEDGEELSAGEWQKVALARAFLREAGIVVLDEPTSALDPLAEHEVLERFHQILARGRMGIIISHRLSTVTAVDRIVVLQGGRVAEAGRHEELLRAGGLYARLFETQARHYR